MANQFDQKGFTLLIVFKSGGTRLYHALVSPISLPANLPRFKLNLTGQPNNPPITDSYLRFEIS